MEQQLTAAQSKATVQALHMQQTAVAAIEAHQALLAEHEALRQTLDTAQHREEVGGSPAGHCASTYTTLVFCRQPHSMRQHCSTSGSE